MSDRRVSINELYLDAVGDAIRYANGSENTYTPAQFEAAIKALKKVLVSKTITENGDYDPADDDADGYSGVTVNVSGGGGGGTLITKTITQNGTYNASSDNADGYSIVTVNVSGGGASTIYYGSSVPNNSMGQNGDIYIKLEYDSALISGGTQYIDTGIAGNTVYGFKISFKPVALKESYQTIMSGYLDNFTLGNKGSLTSYYLRVRGNEVESGNLSLYEVNTISRQDSSSALSTYSDNVMLFSAPGGSRKSEIALYRVMLYDINGDAIADLVPALDGTTPCLYDNVTGNYLYNSGTGTFTYEEATGSDLDSVWVKSNGTWAIWTRP